MNIIISPSEAGIICNALESLKSSDSEDIMNIYGMLCDEVYLHFKSLFNGDISRTNEYYAMWFDEYKLHDARYHV